MSEAVPEETSGPEGDHGDLGKASSSTGMSPYATGGGGVTFERKVAVQFLARLLVGDGVSELGDGRRVVSVAFQQAPNHPADDLVVSAARPDALRPSLVLALAVRRKPKIVQSDESTRKLILAFVRAVINAPMDGREYRWGLVVAGPQRHAKQLAKLANHAAVQMDAPGFFKLIRTPGKFDASIRGRLDHLEKLVKRALNELGVAEAEAKLVQQRTWQLLGCLTVSMPRLESPDETDWTAVTNSLIPVARGSDLNGALLLHDRLVTLASEYAPKAARVNLILLRRDTHALLNSATRRHQRGWRTLDLLNRQALAAVRGEITTSDGTRRVSLDRNAATAKLVAMAADAPAVVVSGESGIGKSALALLGLTAAAKAGPDKVQALSINLRHVPRLPVEFEDTLGCPLSTLLCELSAPQRMLIVDGADAVAEGMDSAFRYLVDTAQGSDVRVVAVTSVDSKQVVQDILKKHFVDNVTEYVVDPLTDAEIDEVVGTFTELQKLNANPRSRELLRRFVVVDLLVRSGVHGVPLSDADAMRDVWSELVRRREMSDRGTPDAREIVLLELANLALCDVGSDGRRRVIKGLDSTALDGLRRDGLLRTSPDNPFMIGPEFAHDEVRRYALARLLLADRAPAEKIMAAGAPRWSLAAARLACQALLAQRDAAATPLRGRFAVLQASFDALVNAGHGARWGDVPGEALITIANPGPVLQDAWSDLRDNDAVGLKRLARLVKQRLRGDNSIVDANAVEPIVELLLEDPTPWRLGEYAQDLLREWLYAHVAANTATGHPLRIQLRQRLVDVCAAADRRLAEEQVAAATPTHKDIEQRSRIGKMYPPSPAAFRSSSRRVRRDIPIEVTSPLNLELLALLALDLGSEGEEILRRVAQDAPWQLAPAVEELCTGRALASYGNGLLALLTDAYYYNDETDDYAVDNHGIRSHKARSIGSVPPAAWYRGPFMPLFRTDFRGGVAVLNRLLNHATRIRVRTLARLHRSGQPHEGNDAGLYQTELGITGERRPYLGDGHVWCWYRGSVVGPYPCFSALQALERVCDQLIKNDLPIRNVISQLLDGCESLAMVGLVVGLLVRHLENAGRLLDPYLTEPSFWHYEFFRSMAEHGGLAANSDGLVAPERRTWSLREAAMLMVVRANHERVVELRALGEKLVFNERRRLESKFDVRPTEAKDNSSIHIEQQLMQVRNWASCLDRDRYRPQATSNGLQISVAPPEDVKEALQDSNEDLERGKSVFSLRVRYSIKLNQARSEPVENDKLEADTSIARQLLQNPPSLSAQRPWDEPALVAAAALEAHFLRGADLSKEALFFAADTVIRVGQGEAEVSEYEFELTYYEDGADRSAARAIPLLLLPAAAPLRTAIDKTKGQTRTHRSAKSRLAHMLRAVIGKAFEWTASKRVTVAGLKLARAMANEVRLHLARGLDHVWDVPCVENGSCHHEAGLYLATETMRDCVLGPWDPETRRRSVIVLKKEIATTLANTDEKSILVLRLNAAIRALAPAATSNICVSNRAHALLLAILDAQQRSLLCGDFNRMDEKYSQILVCARALLTLAEDDDDAAVYAHIDAYASNSALLGALLRALSAAAEETQNRAATARRMWPDVVRHVLALEESGQAQFQDDSEGDSTLAALLPNSAHEIAYLYREIQDKPIVWWDPFSLRSEVEEWLIRAAGSADCIDQLIRFIRVLAPGDQVRTGMPWLATLVLPDTARIARRTWLLSDWLIEMRSVAVNADLLAKRQQIVDALVVAGVTQLAHYSE